jgi:hypothetical protein
MALRLLCKIKKSQHIKSTILVYKPVGDYYSNYNDECFVKLLEILFISEICLKKRVSYDFLSREQAKSECVFFLPANQVVSFSFRAKKSPRGFVRLHSLMGVSRRR